MSSLEHIPCDFETKISTLETGSFSKLAVLDQLKIQMEVVRATSIITVPHSPQRMLELFNLTTTGVNSWPLEEDM